MPFGGSASGGSGGVAARFLSAVGRFARRVPSRGWKVLSSKQAPRGFSKGKGCARTGVQGPDGRFRPVASMLPTYVLPPGGLAGHGGGAGGGGSAPSSSSSSSSLLRPYVAEYPQEQLDAAVTALRLRLAARAARSEALGAERRARALDAARRMRWGQQEATTATAGAGAAAEAASSGKEREADK